jgi:GST-like protein
VIDLYFWPTVNCHKISIFLEECGLPYRFVPVDIDRGDQFSPDFLLISPNNRVPAIVDHRTASSGGPISLFESGAILLYLAERTGRGLPDDPSDRLVVLQWLFWQVGGLGPMAGQAHHFRQYAPQRIEYAVERYTNEVARLYRVLDKRLSDRDYLADTYSICDIACYPWVRRYEKQGQVLEHFPHLKCWFGRIDARPAVIEAIRKGEALTTSS